MARCKSKILSTRIEKCPYDGEHYEDWCIDPYGDKNWVHVNMRTLPCIESEHGREKTHFDGVDCTWTDDTPNVIPGSYPPLPGFHLGACTNNQDWQPAGEGCHNDCPRLLHSKIEELQT